MAAGTLGGMESHVLSVAHHGCWEGRAAPAKGSRWDSTSPTRTRHVSPPCPILAQGRRFWRGRWGPGTRPTLPRGAGTRRCWHARAAASTRTQSVGACDNRQHISQRRGVWFPACHGKHKQPAGTQRGASVSLRAEPVSHSLLKSAGRRRRRRRRRRKDAQGTPPPPGRRSA